VSCCELATRDLFDVYHVVKAIIYENQLNRLLFRVESRISRVCVREQVLRHHLFIHLPKITAATSMLLHNTTRRQDNKIALSPLCGRFSLSACDAFLPLPRCVIYFVQNTHTPAPQVRHTRSQRTEKATCDCEKRV